MRKVSSSATLGLLFATSLLAACGGRDEPEPGAGGSGADAGGKSGSAASDGSLAAFGIDGRAPVCLAGRAVLPAATFVDGPPSGAYAGVNFSA